MPKVGTYRANSVIYFQGDVGDKIFVLQRGKVILNYSDIETGKAIREIIQTGEFFGVKSALGRYPREENCVVLEDANVLVFTVPEFEAMSMSNTRIIIKMLKVFSNQLRHIHHQVENLMDKPVTVNAEIGLFKTGEYYLKNRMYSQAKYILNRYLTYYPAGKMADKAGQYLETAENSMSSFGDGKGPAPLARMASGGHRSDNFPAEQESAISEESPEIANNYYEAMSIFSQGKYQEAFKSFKAIAVASGESEYKYKAMFDMAKCLAGINQWDLVIKQLTNVIQTNPSHPDMADMLFLMGQAWAKQGDINKAKAFYTKVLSMSGEEDASARIKAKKALSAIEGAM